jgi:tetratricopeptide (TPR) repeat protein
MDHAVVAARRPRAVAAPRDIPVAAACGLMLPAALVTYLGIEGGGFDTIISTQVAIAVWWLILLLVGLRIVPLRLGTAGWVGLGLLTAYAAWTALSLTWTQNSENSATDVSQLLFYIGVALLAMLVRGRDANRYLLHGVAAAIVAIACVALLSRLRFEWFGIPAVAVALPSSARKLSYPLNYWNALAALMAFAIPLLIHGASAARTVPMRAVAGGCIPLLALCAFLTVSRGGVIAIAIGIVVLLGFATERLPKVAVTVVAGAGSALLIAAADKRPEVRDGLRTAAAAHQGDQLIVVAIAVALGVALLTAAIALIDRHVERPRFLTVSRRTMAWASGAALVVALGVFVVAGGPGFLHREWDQFKTANATSGPQATALERLQSVSGNGRYQYWQAAAHEANTKPLTGTGAGTFQYWWAQHGTLGGGYVRDAHSLYMQTLGELGYPGLILIAAFIGWIFVCSAWRATRTRDPDRRLELAATLAAAAVFAFSAAFEWIWFIPVLPVALLVVAAVIFRPEPKPHRRHGSMHAPKPRTHAGAGHRWVHNAGSAAIAVVSVGAILVIALPMAATIDVRQSQSLASAGELSAAYAKAQAAAGLQPYAATPRLQEALVLEEAGRLDAATADAQRAVARAPTNSNDWLVLSRLEARSGHANKALSDYLIARRLNPNGMVFAGR